MNWINPLFLIPIITGPVYMLVGIFVLRFPAKNINFLYGYRTKRSMRSKEAWDFAQRYAARELIKSGALLTLMSVIGFYITMDVVSSLILGLVLVIVFISIPIIKTERELKTRFIS